MWRHDRKKDDNGGEGGGGNRAWREEGKDVEGRKMSE